MSVDKEIPTCTRFVYYYNVYFSGKQSLQTLLIACFWWPFWWPLF